jgi:3-phenylpropionate/trans-cinnamate dioxygenase ferredoxin reductase subunit
MHVPSSGEPVRAEHWTNALHKGPLAARNMRRRGKTFDRLSYFVPNHYDVGMECSGLARTWDRVVIDEQRLADPDEPLEDLAATNRATA